MTEHGFLASVVRIATTNTTVQTFVKRSGVLQLTNWVLGLCGITRAVPGDSLRYRLRYFDTAVLAAGFSLTANTACSLPILTRLKPSLIWAATSVFFPSTFAPSEDGEAFVVCSSMETRAWLRRLRKILA